MQNYGLGSLRSAASLPKLEQGLNLDGTIAVSAQQRLDFWNLREHIPEGEVLNGGSIKHDVSVRVFQVVQFIELGSALVAQYGQGACLSIYGHVGDGNIHFNVLAPEDLGTPAFFEMLQSEVFPRLYDLIAKMDGSFSAEYGLGQARLSLNATYGDPVKNSLMVALKSTLAPHNIMNPGKVVSPCHQKMQKDLVCS